MAIIGALIVGILCGIVPYRLGKKKGLEGWGLAGIISCTLGGLLAGMIVAIPLAAIFSAIILVTESKQQPTNEEKQENIK
jgi:predicted PurR-regulated permease PerM